MNHKLQEYLKELTLDPDAPLILFFQELYAAVHSLKGALTILSTEELQRYRPTVERLNDTLRPFAWAQKTLPPTMLPTLQAQFSKLRIGQVTSLDDFEKLIHEVFGQNDHGVALKLEVQSSVRDKLEKYLFHRPNYAWDQLAKGRAMSALIHGYKLFETETAITLHELEAHDHALNQWVRPHKGFLVIRAVHSSPELDLNVLDLVALPPNASIDGAPFVLKPIGL